jgi:hypothetical protein
VGIDPNHPSIRQAVEKGLIPVGTVPGPAKREAVELVAAAFAPPATWTVPLATANESNGRAWRARSRRAGEAWKAVRKAVDLRWLAPIELHLRAGRPVAVRLVRLGGKRLDPLVNLPSALKGVEDALAYLLGVDDGSPLWLPSCDQEPGGPMGVRVTLTCVGGVPPDGWQDLTAATGVAPRPESR